MLSVGTYVICNSYKYYHLFVYICVCIFANIVSVCIYFLSFWKLLNKQSVVWLKLQTVQSFKNVNCPHLFKFAKSYFSSWHFKTL